MIWGWGKISYMRHKNHCCKDNEKKKMDTLNCIKINLPSSKD